MSNSPVNSEAIIKVLSTTKQLIQNGWCQGADAKADNGDSCLTPLDPRAVSFCLVGALYRAAHDLEEIKTHFHARKAVKETLKEWSLDRWNDDISRAKSEVVNLLDRTINKLKARDVNPQH